MFPKGEVIPSGGYYVIAVDGKDFRGDFLHTNFSLDPDGGDIFLFDNLGVLAMQFTYPKQSPWHSYGLTGKSLLILFLLLNILLLNRKCFLLLFS